MPSNWYEEAQLELMAAKKAADINLKGRSRVSARRAAGIAVREYLHQLDLSSEKRNFYELLLDFSRSPHIPANMREIADHLCQRVDENYSLSEGINLLSDAQILIDFIKSQVERSNEEG